MTGTPASSPVPPREGKRQATFDSHALIRPDTQTLPLLAALCDASSPGNEALNTVLARAVWSRLTEPGDAVAGALIARLGPVRSLDLIAHPHAVRSFAQELRASNSGDDGFSPRKFGAGLKRWLPRIDKRATIRDLEIAAAAQMRILTPEARNWPAQLEDLGHHAPHALWVKGQASVIESPSLAVVGARACTGYGSHVTTELTSEACHAGFAIVSGAAYGVDAVAHRTALATGAPTIAVLAGGADRPYPASHDQLLNRIAENGAVCSELAPGAAPTRWRFLQRNRIIAALSRAVLVTEAGVRSGTLNTAGHAAELGRALGAVPGPITSAASAGCHRLVREYGATLVTSGGDLLEMLGASSLTGPSATSEGAEESEKRQSSLHIRVLDALPLNGKRAAADIAVSAGITLAEALEALAELELLRYVSRMEDSAGDTHVWKLLRRA